MGDIFKKVLRRLKRYLFTPYFHLSRFQFNSISLLFICVGLLAGSYLAINGIARIFATTNASIIKDTDTHFSQGTMNSTSVSGSGNAAVVGLSSAGYSRTITVNNSSNPSSLTDYQVAIDEGEVGYWKFDEASGTAVSDASGSGNNGVAVGTTIVDGHNGKARTFNGSSDKITFSSNNNLPLGHSAMTMSVWFKITGNYSSYQSIFSWGNNLNGQRFGVWYDGPTGKLGVENCSAGYLFPWTADSNWHNLIVVIPGNSNVSGQKLYLDGTLKTATLAGTDYQLNITAYGPNIGALNGNIYYMTGAVDEARIYNRAFTQTDVTYLYNNDKSPLLGSVYASAQQNGDDLRFKDSDNSTDLPYWIENFTASGQNAKIWVKVPSIAASTNKNIYIYYGGGGSAQSSVANTFIREVSGVTGAWNMDETAGTNILDSSGNNFTGTATAGVTIMPGKFGNGRKFSTNNYITVTNAALRYGSANSFTIMAWANRSTPGTANYSAIYSQQSTSGNFSYSLQGSSYDTICTNVGKAYVGSNGTCSPSYAEGNWNHFAMTYSPSTVSLYQNGSFLSSAAYTYGSATSNGTALIGNDSGEMTQRFYAGTLDNVLIFNREVTAPEISDIYNNFAYTTTKYPGKVLVRKYSSPEPTISSVGSEILLLSPSGTWESASNSNVIDTIWNGGWGDNNGDPNSIAFSASVANIGTYNTITFEMRTAASQADLATATYQTLGIAGISPDTSSPFTRTKHDLETLGLATGMNRYIQVRVTFAQTSGTNPQLDNFTINYRADNTGPDSSSMVVSMLRSAGGTPVVSETWTNNSSPYFSWTPGVDTEGGVKGYCLYLGSDIGGDPATAKGLLGTSPTSTAGTTCQFVTTATNIDLAAAELKGSPWLTTQDALYYLNVKPIDNNNNISPNSAQFRFHFDTSSPTNVSYISCASGNFSNVVDMHFTWPITGDTSASDPNSHVLGWQYQINSTTGTWQGTDLSPEFGFNYIPTPAATYTLTDSRDGSSIHPGANVVYFRTVDNAGNPSNNDSVRTCNLNYGGAAPVFGGTAVVTITGTDPKVNSYALDWPAANASGSGTITHYYYMINTTPPSTLATLQANTSTYIDNGTSLTVPTRALPNVNKNGNTVYVVAIDNANPANYSPSNFISGSFNLDSDDPGNVNSLEASDSSIKYSAKWNVTLTWLAPSYQGAGNLTYIIKRSSDNVNFTEVGTTSGLSYVDNTPLSAKYYYKVYTRDGANAESSGTNAVFMTPTGKWTSSPSLESGPTVSSLSTRKASISWSTSRTADSKIAFGTSTGTYNQDEVSNSSQVTAHTVNLANLKAGTTYYYRVKWTDEDGNTGISDEKSFTTIAAPTVKNVSVRNIGLTTAYINFAVTNANSVKIYFGNSTAFGGSVIVRTSTAETTYSSELTGLSDGTKYYYKINTFDNDNNEYEGTILDFATLPRPIISNVRIQQVANTSQSTILVSWNSNTNISSIVSYYPEGKPEENKDEVKLDLITGEHQMIIRSLSPQTDYILIVKGIDKMGNEAVSDSQKLTTATDTRPALISDVRVEENNIPSVNSTAQDLTAQLVISWNTDEAATSQVEFGEGTGTTYSERSQEDSNLTFNHTVIISSLTPSKVYHLKAISKDKAGNISKSNDTVTITPKVTDNALELVFKNIRDIFGFL